jgi:hypothetical protein
MDVDPSSAEEAPRPSLHLDVLADGMPAVTPAFGQGCAEAGSVCLEIQGHACGVRMTIGGSYTAEYEIYWSTVNEQTRRCWNDLQYATEYGAYGIAFLLIKYLTKYTVIERARKGPGFDFWLGRGLTNNIFQDKARLEVSGILSGTDGEINYRVKQKLEQTAPSDGRGWPAYVVVVEFDRPTSRVVQK